MSSSSLKLETKTLFKDASFLTATHLVGVGARDADGVEQVFQAVWDGPEVERHFPCHQRVGVVKQVDVAPGQRTVLLQERQHVREQ